MLFCDFHGHSRRKNIFMYGCNVPNQPEDTRLFPFLMSHICPFFIYNYSRFGNQKSKESTARMSLFNELKCAAIYTIESSFCGNDMGPFKNYHFSTNNLMQTGRDFCRTLIMYLPIQVPKEITQSYMRNIQELYNHYKLMKETGYDEEAQHIEGMSQYYERLEKLKNNNKEVQTKHLKKALTAVLRQTADIFSDGNSSSSAGSDRAPSEDNLDIEDISKVLPVLEDPELAMKYKKQVALKKEQDLVIQKQEFNLIQTKTKTTDAPTKKKPKGNLTTSSSIKKINKRANQQAVAPKIEENEEYDADDNGPGKHTISENTTEKQKETLTKEASENRDTTVHKKVRRKNVECKDAQTQTERSDYMLIKQRQQEKQKMLMKMIQEKNKEMNNVITEDPNENSQEKVHDEKTSKLLEEYLQQQKQGLVQNIVNHYQNPTSKDKITDFSNQILKQSVQFNSEKVEESKEGSQAAEEGQSEMRSSPLKKYRNLVPNSGNPAGNEGSVLHKNVSQPQTSQNQFQTQLQVKNKNLN